MNIFLVTCLTAVRQANTASMLLTSNHFNIDLSLLQATEHFKKILQTYAVTFPPQRLASVVDFVFSFFFNHFHLYKFVFTKERDVDKTTTHLCIDTPPQDLHPLAKGTEKTEWERQEVLKKLEEEHNRKLMVCI